MKEYVLTRLHDTIVPDSSVKDWLGAMDCGEDTLDDEAWFVDSFPPSLEHRNVVPAFLFLETELAAANQAGSAATDTDAGNNTDAGNKDGDGDVKME